MIGFELTATSNVGFSRTRGAWTEGSLWLAKKALSKTTPKGTGMFTPDLIGGIEAQGPEATWVVREHRIEYLLPAFAGEEIEVRTWVENIRRVRSLRKYEFIRKSDGKTLVKGETDWVFVNTKTGRPVPLPEEVTQVFAVRGET